MLLFLWHSEHDNVCHVRHDVDVQCFVAEAPELHEQSSGDREEVAYRGVLRNDRMHYQAADNGVEEGHKDPGLVNIY